MSQVGAGKRNGWRGCNGGELWLAPIIGEIDIDTDIDDIDIDIDTDIGIDTDYIYRYR